MSVTDATTLSRGSALRDAVTITWFRSETFSCAMQTSGQPAISTAATKESLTCQLLHALHARWGWSRATGKEETEQVRRRRARTRSGIAQREPPMRVSAGLRACEWIVILRPHLPVLAAQSSVAVSGSLTVAWAAPALHSYANAHRLPVSPQGRLCSPGTPETNKTLRGCTPACKSAGPPTFGLRLRLRGNGYSFVAPRSGTSS